NERSVELHCQPDPGQPPVLIDKVLFEQVIMELVANALDASPDGGRVQLTSGHDEEHAWLEVTDSGAGIKPDKAPRIFDLFFTTKSGGTGFGLATVRKIVDQHGGTVAAENAEQGGAIFRVELPLA
ncbi:MAG: ATP-binding protein, partial [Deltaproteobacteria bacterium]|nr:ATP-binding protein [Deltaproteobacteria bacterium]